jgi:hypothetical protein
MQQQGRAEVVVNINRPPGCPLTYAGSQAVEGMLAGLEGDFVVRPGSVLSVKCYTMVHFVNFILTSKALCCPSSETPLNAQFVALLVKPISASTIR